MKNFVGCLKQCVVICQVASGGKQRCVASAHIKPLWEQDQIVLEFLVRSRQATLEAKCEMTTKYFLLGFEMTQPHSRKGYEIRDTIARPKVCHAICN